MSFWSEFLDTTADTGFSELLDKDDITLRELMVSILTFRLILGR